jgi:hypothetical protein
MLLNRLMALQSHRCLTGPNKSNGTERRGLWREAAHVSSARTIFCPHGEPATGPTLLLKNSERSLWWLTLLDRFDLDDHFKPLQGATARGLLHALLATPQQSLYPTLSYLSSWSLNWVS